MTRPNPSEYAERHARYVDLVPESDLAAALGQQWAATRVFLQGIPQSAMEFRYAPDKWTVREVIGHVLDTERIMGYRLLTVARGDHRVAFQSADEEAYVRAGAFHRCSVPALCEELSLVRQSHVLLAQHLPDEAWDRTGSIGGNPVSARALGYILLGHERHHWAILRDRYHLNDAGNHNPVVA